MLRIGGKWIMCGAIASAVIACREGAARRTAETDEQRAEKQRLDQEAERAFGTALDAMFASRLAPTEEPCTLTLPTAPTKLAEMSLAWPRDPMPGSKPGSETQGYLMSYLRLIGSDIGVAPAPDSGAPIQKVTYGVPAATLIIDRWRDPVVPKHVTDSSTFTVGHLDGRLVVWDPATRTFACGARVSVDNTDVTVVDRTIMDRTTMRTSHEDSLSKVRVDLVNEALRAGLAKVTRLGDPGAAEATACADGKGKTSIDRVIVDLRGVPPARIANLQWLDDVRRQLAKRTRKPVERVWLFDAHTFDVWSRAKFTTGVSRWARLIVEVPVAMDEAVVAGVDAANPALVYLLRSSGLEVFGNDATLCVAGERRRVVDIPGAPKPGVRVIDIPLP